MVTQTQPVLSGTTERIAFDWRKWSPAFIAAGVMAALWYLRLWAFRYDPFGDVYQLIFNYEMFMELLSALAWLVAAITYTFCLMRAAQRPRLRCEQAWFLGLALLCLTAFVEETSWGQHLFKFQTPQPVAEVNLQREMNLHNLNAASLMGISPASPLHSYLQNIGDLLTPLFFLICFVVYAFLPMLRKITYFSRFAVIRRSVTGNVAVAFLFANLGVYFFVNRIFVAYELLEAALSFAVLIAAIDARRTLRLRHAYAH